MSEPSDRRAQKKARTRAHVRTVAHEMFAERGFDAVTIADIARQADVAVQTVFNHFTTKEELFFDGRTPWVTGPADAVRSRADGESPLDALRSYLVELVRARITRLNETEPKTYVRTIEASQTLPAHERELVFQSEQRLAGALREAWEDEPCAGGDPATTAAVTAAMWLSAVRALMVGHRMLVAGGREACAVARDLSDLADHLLRGLAAGAEQVQQPTHVPERDAGVRRAG